MAGTIFRGALLGLAMALTGWPALGDDNRGPHFTDEQREIIREYFRTHRYDPDRYRVEERGQGKPPKRIPPGIAKNLRRGKPLPPGIAKQVLPMELHRRLPRLPNGYEPVIVDDKVILVETATQVIRDVIEDVVN